MRALQLRSGPGVLGLAAADVAAAALFFAYIVLPPRLQHLRHDAVPVALVVFLWLTGGDKREGGRRHSTKRKEVKVVVVWYVVSQPY